LETRHTFVAVAPMKRAYFTLYSCAQKPHRRSIAPHHDSL